MKKFVVVAALTLVAAAVVDRAAQAGRNPGPGVDNARCEAFSSVTYYETYFGGRWGTVHIRGDGDTDLDVFVYDVQTGRLVASGIGVTDIEYVRWYVPAGGRTYRIVVRNLGGVWNRYTLNTN